MVRETRYDIQSTQHFTDNGIIGVWLFLGSPILSGIGYWWLTSELSGYSPNLFGPALVLFLSGMGFLGGCVSLLIGRSQTFKVIQTVKPDVPSNRENDSW